MHNASGVFYMKKDALFLILGLLAGWLFYMMISDMLVQLFIIQK